MVSFIVRAGALPRQEARHAEMAPQSGEHLGDHRRRRHCRRMGFLDRLMTLAVKDGRTRLAKNDGKYMIFIPILSNFCCKHSGKMMAGAMAMPTMPYAIWETIVMVD